MVSHQVRDTRRRLAMNARRLRQGHGWTQDAVAASVGLSLQAVQRLERAAVAVTVDMVARLAAAYAVDVAALFVPAGPWEPPRVGRPPSKREMPLLARYPAKMKRPARAPRPRPRAPAKMKKGPTAKGSQRKRGRR